MTCEFISLPGGGTAVVCSDRKRIRCAYCEAWSTKLCDGPPPAGSRKKTCDKPLCPAHAAHVEGQDLDYCPEHAMSAPQQLTLTPHGGEVAMPPAPGKPAQSPEPGPAAAPPPPEPASNSPEDVGYQPVADHMPVPRVCSSCTAAIFWAQILIAATDPRDGSTVWVRSKKPDGHYKAMPVNSQPDPAGNIVLFRRPGEGIVCRVLRKGEAPPPGAKLRISHFATCPAASKHRRGRGGHR